MDNPALFVPGVPRPHQRPGRAGQHWVQRHDRPQDLCWRTTIRAAWLRQIGSLRWTGRVSMTLVFVGGRGDLDNLVKAVLDALGWRGWDDGLAPLYVDDAQVDEVYARHVAAGRRDSGVFICAAPL